MTIFEGFRCPDRLSRQLSGSAHCISPPVVSTLLIFGQLLIQTDMTMPTSFFISLIFLQASSEQCYHDGKCSEDDRPKPQAEAAAESSRHGAVWASSL